MAREQRYEKPLSVLMLDIDYFKRVNDTYGHVAGNLILAGLGSTCSIGALSPSASGASSKREATKMKITTIGIDLTKNVMQVHGVDEQRKTALRKQLS